MVTRNLGPGRFQMMQQTVSSMLSCNNCNKKIRVKFEIFQRLIGVYTKFIRWSCIYFDAILYRFYYFQI